MKKYIKIITVILSVIILLVALLCLKNRINIEATFLKYERQYAQTNSDADLINLVVVSQKSIQNKKKIQYAQELLDKITEEGLRNSGLSDSDYVKYLDRVPPRDVAIDLYLFTLLSAEEYELYVSEFVSLYPQLSYEIKTTVQNTVPDVYVLTNNIEVFDVGISAYSQLSETTNDELLKQQCIVHADVLREVKAEIQNK